MRAKCLAIAFTSMFIFCVLLPPALAQGPKKHENPKKAEQLYNPVSLFQYYSGTWDFLLKKHPKAVAARLSKLPFANVPDKLREPAAKLNSREIKLATSVEIDRGLEDLGKLVEKYRFDKSLKLSKELAGKISSAHANLDKIQNLVRTIGGKTGASSAPKGTKLRKAYENLLEKLSKTRKITELQKKRLKDLLLRARSTASPEQSEKAEKILKELGVKKLPPLKQTRKPKPTKITLELEETSAFVGEEIHFQGRLSCGKEPLKDRKIKLLLNGKDCASATTGKDGQYRGVFQVPYKYMPEMSLEALYYPHGKDVGAYLASKSPKVKLNVLFYSAKLDLKLEDKAYPGLKTRINGRFDYGESPIPKARQVEVYLDDSLLTKAKVGQDFSFAEKLPPETEQGMHRITVSAPAEGKYAPVTNSAKLKVVKPSSVVDLDLPRVAFVPGSVELSGRAFSEIGPVKGGKIKLDFGGTEAETTSGEDGRFSASLEKGMGLQLIGSQKLKVQVIPQEPWHSRASCVRSLFVVNWVNTGGILVLLSALGILVWRKTQKFKLPQRREERLPIPPQPVQEPRATPSSIESPPMGEPRRRILGWYQRAVRVLFQLFPLSPKPSQTLREFWREISPRLGPASQLFEKLTRLVEKALYSRYHPSEQDAQESEEISREIEKRIK